MCGLGDREASMLNIAISVVIVTIFVHIIMCTHHSCIGFSCPQRDCHDPVVQPVGPAGSLGDPRGDDPSGEGKGHHLLHPGKKKI